FGRLATTAAALARGHALGINPNHPIMVGLIDFDGAVANPAQARDLVARSFGPDAAENLAPVDRGVGVIVSGEITEATRRSLLHVLERTDQDIAIAISRPLASVAQAPEGVREARFALDLQRQGVIDRRIICCGSVDDFGLYSLLYALWGSGALAK